MSLEKDGCNAGAFLEEIGLAVDDGAAHVGAWNEALLGCDC